MSIKREAPKGQVRLLHSTMVQSHPSHTPKKEVDKGSKSKKDPRKEVPNL